MSDIGLVCPGYLCHFSFALLIPLLTAYSFPIFYIIEAIQLIILDQFDQLVGISLIGGVTRFLQSPGPSLIIGDREIK
ncbi:hypothetical protein SDC9_192789 [bioreactor metagenome]|uniref:Uncharacterized protein n=1 Tax=bioreactor metagenome TaxID=1076179 RepID=A0A645I370_9ZZZZ